MATSSFFYGGSPGPDQTTVNELVAQVEQKATDAEAAKNAAQSSATAAANSATAASSSATAAQTAQTAAEAARDASLNLGSTLTTTANTLSAGSSATASYNSTTKVITFGIPIGNTGATGSQGPQGDVGPQGAQGPAGNAATVAVGTVTTGAAGSSASVTNAGTSSAAVLNFTIPRGETGATGAQGATGSQGPAGSAATVSVGTVTTGSPGSSASITNAGTSSAAVFNFTIPRGDVGATGATGPQGPAGTAATVTVGTVTTGAAGSSASVTNSGTSSAATLNFTIPRGDVGATGAQGPQGIQGPPGLDWKGAYNAGTSYVVDDAVSYNGSSYICILASTGNLPTNNTYWSLLAEKGAPGSGSGDVLGPASSVNNGVALFDGTSGKILKDGGALGTAAFSNTGAFATSAQGSNADTAFGWGNHASAGYLTTSSAASSYQPLDGDLTSIASLAGTSGFLKKTAANTWSLDTNTYLTSYTETDPIYTASSWYSTTNNSSNWNTAYGWGNHASAGYATYPSQTGNSGKFLTTNGTTVSWSTVEALPSQTGNTGKYLTTDGTTASWTTLGSTLPSQTGNSGRFLTTDGTAASWSTLPTKLQILTRSSTTTDVSLANGFLAVTNRSGGTVNVGVV